MKKVLLINGSLGGKNSSSGAFLRLISSQIKEEYEKEFISARIKPAGNYPTGAVAGMCCADAVIIAFPLYNYCVSGAMMALLEAYFSHVRLGGSYSKDTKFYAVVNCGYVLPEINDEAIRVVKNFCLRVGVKWRFATAIACGPAVLKTGFFNLNLQKALKAMARDISAKAVGPAPDFYIKPILPRIIMDTVRKNLDREDLKRMKINNT